MKIERDKKTQLPHSSEDSVRLLMSAGSDYQHREYSWRSNQKLVAKVAIVSMMLFAAIILMIDGNMKAQNDKGNINNKEIMPWQLELVSAGALSFLSCCILVFCRH